MSSFQDWIQDKQNRNKTHAYTWRKQEFDAINSDNTDFVLGTCHYIKTSYFEGTLCGCKLCI